MAGSLKHPDVVIVDAARSAVGRKNGSLGTVHPTDILGQVFTGLLNRNNLASEKVDQVIGGCINKLGAQGMNVTRTAWLSQGGAETTPCITIDSQCGSSQEAVTLGSHAIMSGTADVVLACGVESMTRLPIGSDAVGLPKPLGKPVSRSYFEHYEFTSQFEGAERMCEKYQLTRGDTDAYGLRSQELAAQAIADGRFDGQILPIDVAVLDEDGKRTGEHVVFDRDEVPRSTQPGSTGRAKARCSRRWCAYCWDLLADRRWGRGSVADVRRQGGRTGPTAPRQGGVDRAGGLRSRADA